MSDHIVEARDLRRAFERGSETVHALAGIDLDVRGGELLAIAGPSGSGKSTLLYLIGCLDEPTGGRLRLFGQDVSTFRERDRVRLRRERLGFVFQRFHLISTLSVRDNVLLPDLFARRRRSAEEERVALARVGLTESAAFRIDELSNGARQRVAIARALVGGPELLLADEPTGRLDPGEAEEVISLLALFATQGVTVIVATHDPALCERATRTIRLRSGRQVEG